MAENRKRMPEKRKTSTSPKISEKKSKKFDEPTPMDQVDAIPEGEKYTRQWDALAAWFLGPRAENRELMNKLTLDTLNFYEDCRENYFPGDPGYITEDVKASRAYRAEVKDLTQELCKLNTELTDSIPFFSTRYQGHMTWECTMPASLGYLAGMLWNQNNVDSTASPVTTAMEIKVGQHLCQLMDFPYTEQIKPWAHLTGCGSVANIEALWAARNLKLHPLAIQALCTHKDTDKILKAGREMPVFVPELDHEVPLKDCTQWQLLNLDIDYICNMTTQLMEFCKLDSPAVIDEHLKKFSAVSIGMGKFMMDQKMEQSPVFFCPGTCHYSYPKASTILGLGDQGVVPLTVDRNCRVDMALLREKLEYHLANKITVMVVVAVIGSTEESAVDPLQEMYEMRKEFQRRGLNFALHADAAWGGYLLSMIRDPCNDPDICKVRRNAPGYVPQIPLSEYATAQYQAVMHADTVTIDPHKAGFCQYPAGALAYRNGVMKGFITLKAPEVFHGEDDISVGVYGLEGSKPGAAAAGVLLAHRVIGLDKYGFGRILGQCQFGSKLCYCMWMTAAQSYDDFVCLNFIDIPEDIGMSEDKAKKFIRNRILGKQNEDIVKDEAAFKFLKDVGPDALINTFTVNIKGNTDTDVCNRLQDIIFNELNGKPGKSSKRIPLFLTKSLLEQEKYGAAFDQLKDRLGLKDKAHTLGFLRNTSMNPFQASEFYITQGQKIFRNAVLNSIGGLGGKYGDKESRHTFVVAGRMKKRDGKVFMDYVPSFASKEQQYNVVLTMKTIDDQEKNKFRDEQRKAHGKTLYLRTKRKITVFDLLRPKSDNQKICMELLDDTEGKTIMFLDLCVDEVFRYNHLETPEASEHIAYPDQQEYFLYGDNKRAFISHVVSKSPDFHQVVELDELPHSVPDVMLDLGLVVQVRDVNGAPLYDNSTMIDPLQGDTCVVQFMGKSGVDAQTTLKFHKKHARRYFNQVGHQ